MEKYLEGPLRSAIGFLEGAGYRYAIIGGIALSQWGVIRATQDVDIKVLVPNAEYPSARQAIRMAFPTVARTQIEKNPLIVAVEIEEVIVDFLLALPGYEELIIERAVQRDLDGWSAWICAAEDLVIQKVAAGRGKDWLDVEGLLIEQHNRLDLTYIENWISQFAEALEEPELLTRYRQLVTEVERLFK
jgi:predicted nucleotidyltransferase